MMALGRSGELMGCPKCGGKTVRREDEDSWWSQCIKCGHTFAHVIRFGFGDDS